MVILSTGSVISFNLGGSQPYKETSNWYDNVEGVQYHLSSLESFHKLLNERRVAHYQRGEKLNDFFIKSDFTLSSSVHSDSLFHLDEFGQCWSISKAQNGMTSSTICQLPSHVILCPECSKGWDLKNIQDYFIPNDHESVYIPADEFIGKPLKEMWKAFSGKTDGMYSAPADHRVYNPKCEDHTPHPDYDTLKINDWGFIPNDHGVTDPDHILEEGDVVRLWVKRFYHKGCWSKFNNQQMEESFETAFKNAGYQQLSLIGIPNEYCGCLHCASWFTVITEIGKIKIGWRKRVIHIELENSDLDLNTLIPHDVTKGKNYAHAWGWENCEDYLKLILEATKK